MGNTIYLDCIKQHPEDEMGFLTVRTRESGVSKKKSLKTKIKWTHWENHFNHNTQRFRNHRNFPQSETVNSTIQKFFDTYNKNGKDFSSLPDERKSFLKYWEKCIENNSKTLGSEIKHKVILNKLKKYLTSKRKTDLLFIEINPVFLKELRQYLRTENDPKCLSENSVIHYLKVMKSIINQSQSDDYFTYPKNPFNGLKFKLEKKNRPVLNEEEIGKLLTTEITDERIKKVRNMFLFQIFSNGMRVSDLFLLKWNNIISNRLKYTMYKTGTELSIPVNLNMGIILSQYLDNIVNYEDFVKSEKLGCYVPDEEGINKYYELSLKKIDNLIFQLMYPLMTVNRNISLYLNKMNEETHKNMGTRVNYKDYMIEPSNEQLKTFINLRENLTEKISLKFLKSLEVKIREHKLLNGNNFIFPVLSNELFTRVGNSKELQLERYKSIKHHTIVYDRNLKKVQNLCGIETPISSHVSRHSYTNLLLRLDNVNLYDISQSLGHSSIKITENYLRSGFNIEKIDYLNNIITKKHRMK